RLRELAARGEEGLGRLARLLLRQQRLAEPEMRVGGMLAVRIAGDQVAEAGLGGVVVARQDELVGVAVDLGIVAAARRQRRHRRVVGLRRRLRQARARRIAVLVEDDGAEIARRRAHHRAAVLYARHLRVEFVVAAAGLL